MKRGLIVFFIFAVLMGSLVCVSAQVIGQQTPTQVTPTSPTVLSIETEKQCIANYGKDREKFVECILKLAEGTKNENYCKNLALPVWRQFVYGPDASNQEKDACYSHLAVVKRDSDICKNITGLTPLKASCIQNVAWITGEPKICDAFKITNKNIITIIGSGTFAVAATFSIPPLAPAMGVMTTMYIIDSKKNYASCLAGFGNQKQAATSPQIASR